MKMAENSIKKSQISVSGSFENPESKRKKSDQSQSYFEQIQKEINGAVKDEISESSASKKSSQNILIQSVQVS